VTANSPKSVSPLIPTLHYSQNCPLIKLGQGVFAIRLSIHTEGRTMFRDMSLSCAENELTI